MPFAVRAAVGPGFPIGVKLNVFEYQKGGFTSAESVELAHTPQRKDPDIPVRVAVATCNWPGATATQVEQLIAKPMEDTIAQNKFIHPATASNYGIRSASYPGRAVVWVQLAEGLKNTREQFSDINLRLNQLQAHLPQGAGPIQLPRNAP